MMGILGIVASSGKGAAEPVAMNVSNAGTGDGQPLDVPNVGQFNGKPEYSIPETFGQDVFRIRWTNEFPNSGGFAWVCSFVHLSHNTYWSSEDVPFPSDVTSWTVERGGPPTPTITAVY